MSSSRAERVLAGCDPEQSAAILAPAGPVRILAGAGTGKTRSITHRIAYRALTGDVAPQQVLAVTHSSRAAGEMRDRIGRLGVEGVQTRTFHAAALKQLGYFWNSTGLPGSGPTLMNTLRGGRYGLLRSCLAHTTNMAPKDVESTDVLDLDGEITWAKARRVHPNHYATAAKAAGRQRELPAGILGLAYGHYETSKRNLEVLDFDDLLSECAQLLETNTDVADRVHAQYTSFVVDEYQDTDPAQQRLLDAWLGGRDDVTVVGDPYQAIYGFKGGEPSLLSDFTRRYPHAVTVDLIRDYRSTPQVVQAANRLMAHVPGPGLKLIGQRPDGPELRIHKDRNESGEEKTVADRVTELLALGVPAREIAVLHRFNAQAVRLTSALRERGIAVVAAQDDAFFSRPEIRTVLVGLRRQCEQGNAEADGETVLAGLLHEAGYDANNPPVGQGAARGRWEAQAALLDLVTHLPGQDANPVEGIRARTVAGVYAELERRANDEHTPTTGGAVTICTIHKAKGLEWDAVLLPRLTEGSLPSTFAKAPAELEEERRLLYVGLTRARTYVDVFHAKERGDGGWKNQPSRFLSYLSASRSDETSTNITSKGQGRTVKAAAVYTVGQRVTHDTYGLGVVVDKLAGTKVRIDFGVGTGLKTLLSSNAKLNLL